MRTNQVICILILPVESFMSVQTDNKVSSVLQARVNKTWLVPSEVSKADSLSAVTSCSEFEEPHVAMTSF